MNLSTIGTNLQSLYGRTALQVSAHSPELYLIGGIGGFLFSEYLIYKSSAKSEEIRDETSRRLANTDRKLAHPPESGYDELDYHKDRRIINVQQNVKMLKLYAPAIITTVLSITFLVAGHNILNSRNIALAGAYKTVDMAYKAYREKVKEKLGEEEESKLRFPEGVQGERIEVIERDATGKEVAKQSIHLCDYADQFSPYARTFDESNPNWQASADQNFYYLKMVQVQANHRLQAVDHLFLNEVYDWLGIKRVPAGQLVGWVIAPKLGYNSVVDFGLTAPVNANFVNGYSNVCILDFNVDGIVYDII